jgi:hypothetical protein
MTDKPLAIDLFCGLGGWTDGLLAEGYDVVGFDCERHQYGDSKYPAQLVLQDVLTLHGKQFKDAALIVASPPCQEFSYMAMPWSKARAKDRDFLEGRDDPKRLTALFDACFRIQREACEAAGRHIPLVVENVRGAQKWVGRSRWNFGSFHLWGDVPALMPMVKRSTTAVEGLKNPDTTWRANGCNAENRMVPSKVECLKMSNGSVARTEKSRSAALQNYDVLRSSMANPAEHEGIKQGGEWWHDPRSITRRRSSKSSARKAASAMIAKIPLVLAQYIARVYKP